MSTQINAYRAIIPERGHVDLESYVIPKPKPDEVVIRTTKSLISPGTERALLLGLPGLEVQYPKAVGYSHVGEIIQTGEGVTRLKVGDRVASKSRHASHVVVREKHCHKLPERLSDEDATFFQLLATSLQAVRKTRLEIGEAAAIIGVGLIGLFAVQVARVAGALPIVAIDFHKERLNLARDLGAEMTLTPDAVHDLARAHNGIAQVPVVIEATGNPAALHTAFHVAAPGGRIALLGSSRGETENINFYEDVHKRGLTLIGAHIHTCDRLTSAPGWWTLFDEQQAALKLLQHGRVIVEPLITHRFSSERFTDAYALLAEWDLRAMGILIDWT